MPLSDISYEKVSIIDGRRGLSLEEARRGVNIAASKGYQVDELTVILQDGSVVLL